MRAVVWHGPRQVAVDASVPDPRIEQPGDALVRVTLCAICGTDLHAYRGEVAGFPSGTVLGHEFVGSVVAVGADVRSVHPGERVLASDLIACGACWWCSRGWHYQCESASLFGYGQVVGEYHPGGQAELVRVPHADVVLSPIAPELDDEDAILIGDVLATAYGALLEGKPFPGDAIAIVGCGPVGLCSIMCAGLADVDPILAVDSDPRRLAAAERLGAIGLAGGDVLAQASQLTHGRGADLAIEAVGSEEALCLAMRLVRPRGRVVVVGAHHSQSMPFPAGDAFARELRLSFVVGDPIATRERLIRLVGEGELDPAAIISHRLPLDQAVRAYQLFDRREATKIVLSP